MEQSPSIWEKCLSSNVSLNRAIAVLLVCTVILIGANASEINSLGESQPIDNLASNLSASVLKWEMAGQYQLCIEESVDTEVPDNLILAIALTESYARPMWRQQIEFFLARVSLLVFNRLPDYSLGVAQIKPSTARKVLHNSGLEFHISEEELLKLLQDHCTCIRLAGQYLHLIAEEEQINNFDREAVETLLMAYNGQDKNSNLSNEIYRKVVWETFMKIESK